MSRTTIWSVWYSSNPNVWDKINKLHGLVTKAGSKANIQWTLETLDDMLTHGLVEADDLSKRALMGHSEGKVEKGQVAFIIAKRQCKDYLLLHVATTFGSGWQPETLVKMHEVFASIPNFRSAMNNLAWQRDLPKSAIRFMEILEGVLVLKHYDDPLRVQVNNSRAPADFIVNMSGLRKDLDDVKCMFDAEVEAAKPVLTVKPTADSLAPLPRAGERSDEEPPEVSRLEKVVAKLFPKVPYVSLKPFITAAERRVQRIYHIK